MAGSTETGTLKGPFLIGDPSEMVDGFHMQLFSTQKSGISLARWRLECVSGAMMRRELPGGGFNFLHI